MLSFIRSLLRSSLGKVLALIVLTLLMSIPLEEIRSLISERGGSQRGAAEELAQTYAGAQTLVGPFVVLPFTERWSETTYDGKGRVTGRIQRSKSRSKIVFPEQLRLEGTLQPEERYRGIFRVLFYKLDAQLNGRFAAFDATLMPSEAGGSLSAGVPLLAFSLSDVRGIEGTPQATLGGQALKFEQGLPAPGDGSALAQGIHAPLSGDAARAIAAGRGLPFELALKVVGHERLAIVPAADDTQAHIRSSWPHPSFGGQFLATERSVDEQGFEARWQVSSLASQARAQLMRQWNADPGIDAGATACGADDRACTTRAGTRAAVPKMDVESVQNFSVSLAQPVNVYFMAHRAAKYGALFIGLVLMASFMFELFRKLRLHPVQYGLVGLSIALFFLLLLALSEKLAFWQAYAAAASASVLLLAAYFSAVLHGWGRGLGLAGFVAVLYGALYGLLASESNALLLGALLIFGMLSLLMLATRRVDWYALSAGGDAPPALLNR